MKLYKRLAVLAICGLLSLFAIYGCGKGHESAASKIQEADPDPTYAVHMIVNCNPNFFFSRYDVEVSVDGSRVAVLDHGATGDYELSLEAGEHRLVFEEEDGSADGSQSFPVSGETFVEATISCTSEQIEIDDYSVMTAAEKQEADAKAAQEAEEKRRAEEEAAAAKAAQEEAERAAKAEEEEAQRKAEAEANKVLTVANCKPLKRALTSNNEDLWWSFADDYEGRKIKFKGNVAALDHHGSYKTRWDVLFYSGNYSDTSARGAIFRATDKNAYDMGIEDGYSMRAGDNVTVYAVVAGYDDIHGWIEIEPYKIAER